MNKGLRLFVLVVGLLFFFACKTTRKAEKPIVIKSTRNLEEKGADILLKNIHDSAFYGRWISAKASVNANIDNDKNSFNINLRMCRDSAIWVSVSPLLGIEAIRVLLTPDTVRFLDRLNHEYKISGYKLINDLLNSGNLDFEIIQSILIGNLFAYKKNKFNSVYLEEQSYILSTLSKRKLKRSLEEKDPSKPVIQDFYVDGNTFRIIKLAIDDERIQKSLNTEYSDFQETSEGFFPFRSVTTLRAEKNIKVEIDYTKVTVGEVLEFPFSVPKNYKEAR
ncbi:MAG: DUF4292 domain-containing protein [Bacteroidetes bacterium]|jgi:hypothetical protein|nr:DUF4292 domain-containing protein [Bacteroidota bacterium]